jgi:hypothetical protein
MSKKIESLIKKLSENGVGFITGGFANIRGGASNSDCTNSDGCVNPKDCSKSTNTGPKVCDNQHTCAQK